MNKPFFLVNQFEREERLFFAQQAQKHLIALPNRQFRQPVRIHPFQSALIAVAKRPFKSVSGKQVHIFAVAAGDKRHNAPIRPACQRRNFTQEISLTQLSEYVYANASVLSRDFGAEVGMTLTEYVAALRVERAKRLLAENERTIEKIAEECGYTGAKYFREQFKRLTGLTPQAYRAKMTADA